MNRTDSPLTEASKLRALYLMARCFLLAFFVVKIAAPVADLDMWHEMALIRESQSAGHLLTTDVYAYTSTIRPVVDHEWGAGALLYLAVKLGGGWAVVLLKYLVALLTGAAVLWCAKRRGARFEERTLLPLLVIPAFSLGCATLRAQAYSFLLFAALLCLLALDEEGSRWWAAGCVALFAVWVNLHGGAVVGLIALGLYGAERLVRGKPYRHILGALAGSVAALVLNPYGLAYFHQLWGALRMARPEITEWYGIVVLSLGQRALFWATVAIAVAAVLFRGWRACTGLLIVAAMAYASVQHARMIPFYAVAWAAYVPAWVGQSAMGAFVRMLFRNRLTATAVCLVLTMFLVVMAYEARVFSLTVPNDRFPVGAARYLKGQRFHGNVMTHFEHGGYVSWWLYPAVKVSVDSRYETAYPASVVDESFRFFKAAPDWRQILAKYPTDLVLAPANAAVADLLPGLGWSLAYRDEGFRIYARPGLSLPFRDDSGRALSTVFP